MDEGCNVCGTSLIEKERCFLFAHPPHPNGYDVYAYCPKCKKDKFHITTRYK